jgi:cystathionine gamma-lyase
MSYRFDTRAIHAGQPDDTATGAIAVPIYQTSTFAQSEPGVHQGYAYGRSENPTRTALEANLAALEEARFGLAFASGLAAVNNVLNLLEVGDHVVSCSDLYGGSYRLFTKLYARFGIAFTFVDTTDLGAVERAFQSRTRLLWLESPSNPLLRVTDLEACATLARDRGAVVVVDNTFATPVLQRPLALGADVVVHSTTKYLNGHSDVIGGAVLVNSPELHERLRFFQNAVGAVPSPHDCSLVLRGIKTLSLRVARHCFNARTIAEWLAADRRVSRVHYPGLTSHPQHALAGLQMTDYGGIVSFELGDECAARAFSRAVRLWSVAESLGGPWSLLCHPPTMTHASVEPEVRRRNGISDGLIRLSPGLEDVRDLIEDLDQALAVALDQARGSAELATAGVTAGAPHSNRSEQPSVGRAR